MRRNWSPSTNHEPLQQDIAVTTLVVFLPPQHACAIDAASAGAPDGAARWRLPDLAFALFDKQGQLLREGRAPVALLPCALRTRLVLDAADTLLISATVPPLQGARLRQALPNLVEDSLLQDASRSHFALLRGVRETAPSDVVAVCERAWFSFVLELFAERRLVQVLPRAACLTPPPEAAPTALYISDVREGPAGGAAGALAQVLRWHGPMQAEGLVVPAAACAASLSALGGAQAWQAWLAPGAAFDPTSWRELLRGADTTTTASLPTAVVDSASQARAALAAQADLRQFEFANSGVAGLRGVLRRFRLAGLFLGLSLLIAVLGLNLDWWRMARENARLDALMSETLMTAFPGTTVILDPAAQMARQLSQLRAASGAPSPDDFLPLASALADSLGGIPATALAGLGYRDGALSLSLRPGTALDAGFDARLAANGLVARRENGNWIVRRRDPAAAPGAQGALR